MIPTPLSWRDLLRRLTEHPAERQRVAQALGVAPYTVTRWVEGLSEPRLQNLKRLPEVFPAYQSLLTELIQADLTPHAPEPLPPQSEPEGADVPAAYLLRVLSAYATTSGPFRAWSLRHLTLQQAIAHLDPERCGMQLTVVRCTPPASGLPVRSLCAWMSVGTAPWNEGISRRLLFLGTSSLAGWTVARGEPGVVQQQAGGPQDLWIDASPQAAGAVAWPLQREGKGAGCLLIVSTQKDYFTSARLALIESYANVLALSFADQEFSELKQDGPSRTAARGPA
jgi:transcriptional regulator with XRE-family HTH domain